MNAQTESFVAQTVKLRGAAKEFATTLEGFSNLVDEVGTDGCSELHDFLASAEEFALDCRRFAAGGDDD